MIKVLKQMQSLKDICGQWVRPPITTNLGANKQGLLPFLFLDLTKSFVLLSVLHTFSFEVQNKKSKVDNWIQVIG